MCSYHPSGEDFLLPLVYIYTVRNGLAVFFCSFSHVPMGRPRTVSVGLQLMLSLCSVELGRNPVADMWAMTGDNQPPGTSADLGAC